MRQIHAILYDSYKLLLARKLFWVSLAISLLVALLYASVGFNDQGVSVLFGIFKWPIPEMATNSTIVSYIYTVIFTDFIFPWWLGGFSLLLALISVCPIFPDFLQAGSIDIAISKPINRLTLFLTKYIGCLFFVAFQVATFCLIIFIAQGVRLDEWRLEIFWAIPLLTLVFSMIFCGAVFTSITTRSTLLSLLIALLIWGISTGVQIIESVTAESDHKEIEKIHNVVHKIDMVLPKPLDTLYLLKRQIKIDHKSLAEETNALVTRFDDSIEQQGETDLVESPPRKSTFYILSTSAGFQLIILALSAFIFVRKDF